MKNLITYIEESLLNDVNNLESETDLSIKDSVLKWIMDNYYIVKSSLKISNTPNADGKYEVSYNTSVSVKNSNITYLTNDLFVWKIVKGDFSCYKCNSLKSLEGAPEKVKGGFDCYKCDSLTSLKGAPKICDNFHCFDCNSLKSLEGAPEKVKGGFDCSSCNSLKSLEGAPEKVGGSFACFECNSLTSLEGAPQEVGRDFNCSNCNSLTSFEYAPKKVGRDFNCSNCVSLMDKQLPSYIKVKGRIIS